MHAKLFSKTGEFSDLGTFEIASEATIGRSADNTVQLNNGDISSHHARIYFDEDQDGFFIEDLESSNGTSLGGTAVTGPARLDDFCVITLASKHDFIFQRVGAVDGKPAEPATEKAAARPEATPPDASADPEPTAQPETPAPMPPADEVFRTVVDGDFSAVPDMKEEKSPGEETVVGGDFSVAPDIQSDGSDESATRVQPADEPLAPPSFEAPTKPTKQRFFCLEVTVVGTEPQLFDLTEGENTVGRSKDCDICVNHDSLSRKHAVIFVAPEGVRLKDLGSVNHCYVNDTQVDGETGINEGIPIRFGLVQAQVLEKTE